VLSTKAKQILPQVVARCLQVSKLLVRAGALLGLRRLKYHFFLEPDTLFGVNQKTVWCKPAVFFISSYKNILRSTLKSLELAAKFPDSDFSEF